MTLQGEINDLIAQFSDDISRVISTRDPSQTGQSSDNVLRRAAHSPAEERIVCLIDGDGNIFSANYLSRGIHGGNEAAEIITQVIQQKFPPDLKRRYRLHVWIFLNKKGLRTTLESCGLKTAAFNLGDFIRGFNQSSRHFMMVDVGGAKEAADHKICALLEEETLSPLTTTVILGACHDNGYAGILKELKTRGYKQKLWLLEGYQSMASHIHNLDLQIIRNKGLFMSKKLETSDKAHDRSKEEVSVRARRGRQRSQSEPPNPSKETVASPLEGSFPSPHPQAGNVPEDASTGLSLYGLQAGVLLHSPTSISDSLHNDSATTAVSYTFTSGTFEESKYKGALALSNTDTCSLAQLPSPSTNESMRISGQLRSVNRNLPIEKQRPSVCALHYISGSCNDTNCQRKHDYDLTEQDVSDLAAAMKRRPCRSGSRCKHGPLCIYGHGS